MSESGNFSFNSTNVGFFVKGKLPKTMACSLLLLISTLGNSFIIWTIYKDNRLKTTINYLVANIALSDLIVTLCSVPLQIVEINFDYRWLVNGYLGIFLCKFGIVLYNVCAGVSMYTGVFIAFDRYYAVSFPMQCGFRRSKLKHFLPSIWAIAILIILPFQDDMKLETQNNNSYCIFHSTSQSRYINFMFLIGIPITIVSIIYVLIVFKLRQHKCPGHQTDLLRKKRDQINRKVLRLSVVIVTSSYISWIFYAVVVVLAVTGKLHNLPNEIATNLVYVANFMIQLFFTYNFFVYLIFNRVYRKNFEALVTRFFSHCFSYTKQENNVELQIVNVRHGCNNNNG